MFRRVVDAVVEQLGSMMPSYSDHKEVLGEQILM